MTVLVSLAVLVVAGAIALVVRGRENFPHGAAPVPPDAP